MGMDQYLLIPFLGGWTSINPSYFDVNYRGTRFWHTAILENLFLPMKKLPEFFRRYSPRLQRDLGSVQRLAPKGEGFGSAQQLSATGDEGKNQRKTWEKWKNQGKTHGKSREKPWKSHEIHVTGHGMRIPTGDFIFQGRSTIKWIKKPSNMIFETHQVMKSTIKTHGFDYIYNKSHGFRHVFWFPKLRSFTQTCGFAPGILRSHFFALANHFVFPQGISKPGCDVGMAQNYDHPRMDALIYFDLLC